MVEEHNNKYKRGKIYSLININDGIIFYIGSTIKKLNDRLSNHKHAAFYINNEKSYNTKLHNFIRSIGADNININLIEQYPCNNKKELLYRERFYIEMMRPDCNVITPIISTEEKKEYDKKYRKDNKEELIQYNIRYRKENRDELLKNRKKYYEDNKEKLLQYQEQYKKDNEEKIKEKRKQYYQKNKE